LKGHLWQGRFFSSILDDRYLYAAVRYVENNPVRAGLVKDPWDWGWSSARTHVKEEDCGVPLADITQFMEIIDWKEYLSGPEDEALIKTLKDNTLRGRPSAAVDFISNLEKIVNIKLTPQKKGRPLKK
jgi:putative transposase